MIELGVCRSRREGLCGRKDELHLSGFTLKMFLHDFVQFFRCIAFVWFLPHIFISAWGLLRIRMWWSLKSLGVSGVSGVSESRESRSLGSLKVSGVSVVSVVSESQESRSLKP